MHDCAAFSGYNFATESDLKKVTTDLETTIVELSNDVNMNIVGLAVIAAN